MNATGDEAYYRDEIDRITWIRQLVRVAGALRWTCIAFCQVTTHVHVLIETTDWSLPLGMKRLNFAYSRYFNDSHLRVGQFVRRRYGSRRVEGTRDLLGTYAYVVLNAVEAGLCPRAEDWRWSSYATTLGVSRDFPFVDASLVLAELGDSSTALRALVQARLDARVSPSDASGV